MLLLYLQFREGRMIGSGSLGEQAAGYMDAMNLLHSAFKEFDAEKISKTTNKKPRLK